MAKINLLPWREQLREERKQRFLVSLGVVVILAGALVFLADRYMNSRINGQNQRNAYLQEQIANMDREIEEIRELQQQKTELTARMNVIQNLQGTRPVIVRLFDELVRTLPEGLYFENITRTNDIITMRGVAESNGRISALMRALDESDWFQNSDLRQVTALGDENSGSLQEATRSQFLLTVRVTTPGQEEEEL